MPVCSLQPVNGARAGRQQAMPTNRYIVSARDEADARQALERFERDGGRQQQGLAEDGASPWQDEDLTRCREMVHHGATPPSGLIIEDTTQAR